MYARVELSLNSIKTKKPPYTAISAIGGNLDVPSISGL